MASHFGATGTANGLVAGAYLNFMTLIAVEHRFVIVLVQSLVLNGAARVNISPEQRLSRSRPSGVTRRSRGSTASTPRHPARGIPEARALAGDKARSRATAAARERAVHPGAHGVLRGHRHLAGHVLFHFRRP